MAQIDSRVARLSDYTDEVEAIKEKIADIAEQKDIAIEENVDTPISVLTKINNGTIKTPSGSINIIQNGTVDVTNYASAVVNVDTRNFMKYHIEQTIDGDTSTLAITDYVAQASDNYLVGVIVEGDTQKLYIVEE